MRKQSDLTAYAIDGFNGKENNLIYSSPAWYAHCLGEYFRQTGKSEPKNVRMSRGYQIHANGMLFAFNQNNEITSIPHQEI